MFLTLLPSYRLINKYKTLKYGSVLYKIFNIYIYFMFCLNNKLHL